MRRLRLFSVVKEQESIDRFTPHPRPTQGGTRHQTWIAQDVDGFIYTAGALKDRRRVIEIPR